jgi:hypothetical protein
MKLLTVVTYLAMAVSLSQGGLAVSVQPRPDAVYSPPLNLYLRAGTFDPLQGDPALGKTGAFVTPALADEQAGLRLVQFSGPVLDEWYAALIQSGLQVVSYVPDYAYLVWGSQVQIDQAAQAVPLRWEGQYLPAYALSPSLASPAAAPDTASEVEVMVQVYDHPASAQVIEEIQGAAMSVYSPPQAMLTTQNIGVRVTSGQLDWLAALPGVVNVEPRLQFEKLDEMQGQIMAGTLIPSQLMPSGPGYLAWLAGKGFSTNPNDYPIVDVTDDGIDNGSATPTHSDFFILGNRSNADRLAYNFNWTTDATADGVEGHGNINASIVAGYNSNSGFPYEDSLGYNYGLGINPYGRVAGSKIFTNAGAWALIGDDFASLLSNTYALGGRIGSYSWGAGSDDSYTVADQAFDILARDAQSGAAGNQQITMIVSAGNNDSAPAAVTSPARAKNVITVGASENYRPGWTDGCGTITTYADSAQDIAPFSSRGPTPDGRAKPELVAPGTHITGAATQIVTYTGKAVCNPYYPSGQVQYAASTGTSHSAPAVAGAASLLYRYYTLNFGGAGATPPSPAMIKAYLVNSLRYLTGYAANDTLPSNDQGFGLVNLGMAFDGVSRVVIDQSQLLSATGQVFTLPAGVVDPSKPLRVSLAWTDAPGNPAVSAAYVNNLDLEVDIGGQTYKGNVFSGSASIPGGSADAYNNLENVFLPAGQSGTFTVRVRAANIAGDGLPGNGDATDQDFALVIYNASTQPGRLQGVVTGGGGSLTGATIQVRGPQQVLTQTLANGVYSLPLPSGVYTATAWKYGYLSQTYTNLNIALGQITARDFSLAAAPQYALGGCVRDQSTGQGLYASLLLKDAYGGTLAQASTTRDNPCYALTPYAGSYTLSVTSLLHQPAQAAIPLSGQLTQDFNLVPTTTNGMILGTITNQADGLPLAGAWVTANPGNRQAQSAGDGSYAIQAPPGTYTLVITATLYSSASDANVIVTQSNLTQKSYALAAPHLSLSSPGAQVLLGAAPVIDLPLVITNTGLNPLEFQIVEASGAQLSQGDVAWLSVSPVSGTLPGGNNQALNVQLQASQIPFTNGKAAIRFLSNDPRGQPYVDYVIVILRNPQFLPIIRR